MQLVAGNVLGLRTFGGLEVDDRRLADVQLRDQVDPAVDRDPRRHTDDGSCSPRHSAGQRGSRLAGDRPAKRDKGSKLKLGIVYAAQEVTGVDHQVLANTKNWVVAHLNNSHEVNHLGRYYDFKAFGDAIISHEDKGYIRLKTMSSPYISAASSYFDLKNARGA
jgi:hypothetical protein